MPVFASWRCRRLLSDEPIHPALLSLSVVWQKQRLRAIGESRDQKIILARLAPTSRDSFLLDSLFPLFDQQPFFYLGWPISDGRNLKIDTCAYNAQTSWDKYHIKVQVVFFNDAQVLLWSWQRPRSRAYPTGMYRSWHDAKLCRLTGIVLWFCPNLKLSFLLWRFWVVICIVLVYLLVVKSSRQPTYTVTASRPSQTSVSCFVEFKLKYIKNVI